MTAASSLFTADALAGKRVLVTGASSGLGAHFAKLLARHGGEVTLAARRVATLEALVAQIRVDGGTAVAIELDVRSSPSVAEAFAAGAFDIVINNAGIALTRKALDVDDEAWNAVLDTDLTGAFRVAREAARGLADSGRPGAIVNIASVLAFRVAKQVSAYVAAKAALVKLTEALALEFAPHGIRVNALAPGYVETELNADFLRSEAGAAMVKRVALRRFGVPADLDGALLLLASDAGRYMTGTTIVVDGGHTLAWL